ncbi:MAG: hypothetical protein QNJ94_06480 [Alphaproteobacteria bacterium]|nr:hypothetical protein [Alphaproteobacteria bacterium]
MTGGVCRGIVVPHAPRLGLPEIVPDFAKALVQGIVDMGEDIRKDKPDAIIVCSAHYVSTFNWHASTVERHEGYSVAQEAPDLLPGQHYSYPGDPELGHAIKDEITALGFPCVENASEHYSWDYGTWVPIHYMDPNAEIPVINIPVVLAADLEESFQVGQALHRACEKTGRRGLVAASSSFAHKLERGPEKWPSQERQDRDREFIGLLLDGRIDDAWAGFADYAGFVVNEMGGRPIALLLGALTAAGATKWETAQFGPYGQSSASGNANVSMKVAA